MENEILKITSIVIIIIGFILLILFAILFNHQKYGGYIKNLEKNSIIIYLFIAVWICSVLYFFIPILKKHFENFPKFITSPFGIILTIGLLLYNYWENKREKKNKLMNSWMGHHKATIIDSWGPPTGGVVSNGRDGEILMYNDGLTTTTNKIWSSTYYTSNTHQNYRHVYCDKKGKIYKITWG